MNSLSTQEVLQILPHRYPFLMIDRVLDYTDQNLIALKNLSINEPYLQGHFPGNHLMPGVLMVESMAQASTVLAFKYFEKHIINTSTAKYFEDGSGFLFVGADKVRFKKVVTPGDQLIIETTLVRNARNLFDFDANIKVNDIVVAEAKLKAIGGIKTKLK
jgi:3-hydroxyacyl-[acyl-carrier-protein] dehydratase